MATAKSARRQLVALVLAAASAFGAGAKVSVRVRDGDTGRSLIGAKVKAGERVLCTDADGAVVAPAVVGRSLVLKTSMEGYFAAVDTVSVTTPDARLVVTMYGTRPRTVIGFVRDGHTGKPLARSLVRVRGDAAAAKTDSTGMYMIPFPPGYREIVAALPGLRGFPRRLSVKAGDTLAVDLPLFDTSLAVGEIAGRVEVHGFGAAIGASVTVEGTRLGTASDRNGDYILSGVPAGTHRIVVSHAGLKRAMKVVNVRAWESVVVHVQLKRRPPPGRR
jgi:hypothetical protein